MGGNPSGRVRKPFKCLPTHFDVLINASQFPTPPNSRTLLLVSPSAHDQSTKVDTLQCRPNPNPLQDRVQHASSSYCECQEHFEHRHQPIARRRVCYLVYILGDTSALTAGIFLLTYSNAYRICRLRPCIPSVEPPICSITAIFSLFRHLKLPQHVGFKVRPPSSSNSM